MPNYDIEYRIQKARLRAMFFNNRTNSDQRKSTEAKFFKLAASGLAFITFALILTKCQG